MFRLFSNPTNLQAVFASYGTIEAVKVKCNIDLVVRRLKIPSQALLEQMQQEGISLNELDQAATTNEMDWSLMSETVLRSHLRAAFLDEAKLFNALASLNLSQQAELRDKFNGAVSHLKLPSEMLLRRMQEEGLGLEKFGVTANVAARTVHVDSAGDKLEQIRNKLNLLTPSTAMEQPLNTWQQPVFEPQNTTLATDLGSIKARIQQLKQQPNTVDAIASSANVVALTPNQNRLKA